MYAELSTHAQAGSVSSGGGAELQKAAVEELLTGAGKCHSKALWYCRVADFATSVTVLLEANASAHLIIRSTMLMFF